MPRRKRSKYEDLDNFFLGGQRLQRQLWVTNGKQRKGILKTLREVETHQPAYIQAIFDGALTVRQVVEAARQQSLTKLPIIEELVTLDPHAFKWVDGAKLSRSTQEGYRDCFTALLKVKPNGKINDLPVMMQKYRTQCEKKGTARIFNYTRTVSMSYVARNFGGKHTPIWNTLSNIPKLEEEDAIVPYLTPREVYQLLDAIKMSEAGREIVWSLVCTGMRSEAEYWNTDHWKLYPDRIHVLKGKNKYSRRHIPLIHPDNPPQPPRITRKEVNRKLKQYEEQRVTVRHLRNVYSTWLASCGILPSFQAYYLGHSPRSEGRTVFYQRITHPQALQSLPGDADLLRKFIDNSLTSDKAETAIKHHYEQIRNQTWVDDLDEIEAWNPSPSRPQ